MTAEEPHTTDAPASTLPDVSEETEASSAATPTDSLEPADVAAPVASQGDVDAGSDGFVTAVEEAPPPEAAALEAPAAESAAESAEESGHLAEAAAPAVEPEPEPAPVAAEPEPAPEPAPEPERAPEPEPEPEPERPEPTTMEELLSEQAGEIRSLKHGDVVEGTVVRIDKDEMLVDIGAKSEGVVSNRELYGRNTETQPQLSIGDTVLVYVLQPESQEGHAVLSLKRAGLERKWRAMQEQLDAGVVIDAPVIDHNKGGLIVDCGIRGFVPISQIVDFPRRPQNDQPRDAAQEIAEKLQPYVGRRLRLKILEVNRKANRLILSEKVALYEERREKRDELFSSLTVGQKVTGTVRSIAPFGIFIDLGGIDGLVHKSELSWNKVNNPESGYQVGDEVEAEVIDINHERGRISLSVRRLQPDPWQSTVADLKVGDILDGTVTKIVNFGAFVRVRDGLEGLIHISELSHQRVAHPGDVVHEGQTLKLKVISLDSERHRLGLSLKQAEEAPQRAPEAPRERRPRFERSYDASQAVQEPEGGIDNTLAAAFAQVRQQVAAQEAAAGSTEPEPEVAVGSTEPEPEVAAAEPEPEPEPEPVAAAAEPEVAAEPEPEPEPVAAAAEPEVAAEEPEPEAAEPEPEPVAAAAEPEVAAEEPEPEPEPVAAAAEPEPEAAEPEPEPEPLAAAAEPEVAAEEPEPEAEPVAAAAEPEVAAEEPEPEPEVAATEPEPEENPATPA